MQRVHRRCMTFLLNTAATWKALQQHDASEMARNVIDIYGAWQVTVAKYVPIVCKQFYQGLTLSSPELMPVALRIKY
jgi:hypothetical protein